MADRLRLAGVFVVVLALVLVVAAAVPLLASSGGDATPRPQNPVSFQPENIVPRDLERTGTVDVPAGGEEDVVLIDRAHDNDFDREEIQPLVDALVDEGYEVRFHGSGAGGAPAAGGGLDSPLNQSLRGADAFVVIAPGRPFTDAARRGVADFADRGGRVALLGEPPSPSTTVVSLLGPVSTDQPTSQMTALTSQFGIGLSTGYLYNMYENGNNYRNVYATPAGRSPLTDGVDRVLFERGTAVTTSGDATVALSATNRTALSSTRRRASYPVAAVTGDVALLGDSSFLSPENYRYADNEVLLGNLAEFLVSGEKTPKPLPGESEGGVPSGVDRPPADQPPANGTTPPAPSPDLSTERPPDRPTAVDP